MLQTLPSSLGIQPNKVKILKSADLAVRLLAFGSAIRRNVHWSVSITCYRGLKIHTNIKKEKTNNAGVIAHS